MSKKETELLRPFLKRLRKLPGSWWIKVSQRSERGTPDILGCVPCNLCGSAKFSALEVKTEEGKADPLQELIIRQLLSRGVYARVVCLPREGDEVIQALHRLQSGKSEPPDS